MTSVTVRVTIADVAREAGVSSMTVSRVINDKGDVSAATRQRVLDVVDRLGYRPSGIARGLATQRTGTIGLVVPDVANPFFADVVKGVEHVAYARGYNVFLCNTEEDPQREQAVLRSLDEKRVDGLILCSSRLEEHVLREVVLRQRCVVLVNRHSPGDQTRSVLVDDESGGRLVSRHLLRAGRRAVGYLAGPQASHSGQLRGRGYRAALAELDLPYQEAWVRFCRPDVSGGYEAAIELLAAQPALRAVLCFNDLVAVGAMQACAELDLSVPTDVAIAGYDDIPLAALVTPPLTTCRVPRYELGGQAMRLLLAQIDGCHEDCDEIVLQPELIVRASAP